MPILRNTGARKAAGDRVKDDAAEMPSIVGRGSGIRTRDPLLPNFVRSAYNADIIGISFYKVTPSNTA